MLARRRRKCDRSLPVQSPNEDAVSAAVSAVGRVFCSLLERHYSWFSSVERKESDDIAQKYQKWMKKKYQTTLQMLVELLTRPSLQVAIILLSHDPDGYTLNLLYLFLLRNRHCRSCCSWYKPRDVPSLSQTTVATVFLTTPSPQLSGENHVIRLSLEKY